MIRDFNVIAAITLKGGVIGDSSTNSIPWHLPTDLKQFKALTHGTTVVMGAKTYESLRFKNLPNRRNVVLTSKPESLAAHNPDAIYSSFQDVLKNENTTFWAIGGSRLYDECLNYHPRRICLTLIDDSQSPIKGDVKFPFIGEFVDEESVVDVRGVEYRVTSWLWQEENGIYFKFVELNAIQSENN